MSNPSRALDDMFPFEFEEYDFQMTRKEFYAMNNNIRIPIQLVKELNVRLSATTTTTGRIVCTDEKHREVQIGWKYSRFAKNKNGHWITETTLLGPTTALPLFILLQPTTSVDIKQYDNEPYNNVPVNEQLTNVVELTDQHSIHIADSYYPDILGMRELARRDTLYMFKVSKKRFLILFNEAEKILEKRLKKKKRKVKIGDFVVMRSEETQQHFMMYVSEKLENKKEYKRKAVLTNAFLEVAAPDNYIGPNTISLAFKEYFNPCDRANARINAFEWPYRRNGWESSYDDFFVQSVLLNCYTCYHEAQGLVGENNHLHTGYFLEQLSNSLMESIRR